MLSVGESKVCNGMDLPVFDTLTGLNVDGSEDACKLLAGINTHAYEAASVLRISRRPLIGSHPDYTSSLQGAFRTALCDLSRL